MTANFRKLFVLFPCFLVPGCSHAPNQDVLGSFFPAWMLCAGLALLLTVLVRLFLVKAGIDAFVPAKLPTYGALALAATLTLWLLWFGN